MFFSYPVGDADLGWHLKYGEIFLQTGQIVKDNVFSWTLPDYKWANHSWGFDIIAATLFSGSHFWLLSLSAGLLISVSLLITLPSISIGSLISLGIFWFFGSELFNTGLRSQLFSFLFTAILWRFLMQKNHLRLIPIIFFLWANLHGQFIYGLVILALYILPQAIKKDKEVIIVGLSSLLITLINPFGIKLWQTAFTHLNAPELKFIYEWTPWDIASPKMIGLLLYSAFFWWQMFKHKKSLQHILPLAAVTLIALTSRRGIPYFLIISLPYLSTYCDMWLNQRIRLHHRQIIIVTSIMLLLILGLSRMKTRNPFTQSWDTYCHTNVLCSEGAITYMREHHVQGKLWNAYRLGGHLIYRLPEIKPMVDGRMTVWRGENGSSPFLDYTTMVYLLPGSKQLFYSMNPDYVLIQPQYPLAQTLLTAEKWPIRYADDQVILFQNPNTRYPID